MNILNKKNTWYIYLFLITASFFFWSDFQKVRGENIFVDADQDGLSNEEERLYKTDPNNKDTDGDGYSDGVEVASGYDPLKKAPGDRLFQTGESADRSSTTNAKDNITDAVAQELAATLNETGNEDLSLDDVDARLQEILSGKGAEVVLPPIELKGLKIKEAPSDKLSEEERLVKEKEDAVKYLTAMSYILASNSPQEFSTEAEFGNVLNSLSGDVILSLSSGNKQVIENLANNGRVILEKTKDIEVPEKMLYLHIKALQLAEYSISLEEEMNLNSDDPLREVSDLMKVQSLLSAISAYIDEVQQKMSEYGISTGELNI